MPKHSTPDPIDTAAKAIDALLSAIETDPTAGASAAYRAALYRHGRNLIETAGPESLDTVRERVAALSPLTAEDRREIVTQAWAGLAPVADIAR